jgi:hypothetical protein
MAKSLLRMQRFTAWVSQKFVSFPIRPAQASFRRRLHFLQSPRACFAIVDHVAMQHLPGQERTGQGCRSGSFQIKEKDRD